VTAASETTVVIPTWNSLAYLPRCSEALQLHSPDAPIVVVDNGSTDGTVDWLDAHAPGVSVLRNATNEGFGAACNRGAASSSTPWVCFLNADAFVTDGWLEAMHETAATVPGAALVGPMLLNEDGTLQEAGAMLSQTADGVLHGYGADPEAWEYRFPRVVDYCSAACLLVRRPALEELGGFDVATFGLAYYEDVDLCLRAAELGLRTVYAPDARVVHVRNPSGRSATVSYLMARNRLAFSRRWRELLARRPSLNGLEEAPHRLAAVRDADRFERLLVVCRDLPQPGEPITAELLALPALWPNMRAAIVCDARPSDEVAAFWLGHGFEVSESFDDWYRWFRSRLAHFTAVLAIGTETLDHFGAMIEWTQVDFLRLVVPARLPAETWRRFHQQGDPYLFDEPFDRDSWTAYEPSESLRDRLVACGWPAPEL
jgi:GT2 family glycosyltransferase